MTTRHKNNKLAWMMGLLSLGILFGCATPKPLWGDRESGLVLTYRGPEDKGLQYRNTVTVVQDLTALGQKTETKSDTEFTLTSNGKEGGNLILGIRVDQLRVDVGGPQGSSAPDTSGLAGKGFTMVLSPQGKELDLSGASELTYEANPFSKSSLQPLFIRIFPDLPSDPVKVGDTWTSVNDSTSDDGARVLNTVMENVNSLAGFETIDGLECAKITKTMTGTLKGKGSQMGMEFTMGGSIEGSATWYFAYKIGALVSQTVTFTGDITIESAMGAMPVILTNVEEVRLIP